MRSILVLLACAACSKPSPPTPSPAVDAGVDSAVVETGGGRGEGIGLGGIPASMHYAVTMLEGPQTTEVVERLLRGASAPAACYRSRAPGTVGVLAVDVKVAESGKPASVETVSTTFDEKLTSCLTSALGGVSFPVTPPAFRFRCEVRFAPATPGGVAR